MFEPLVEALLKEWPGGSSKRAFAIPYKLLNHLVQT